MRRTPIIFTLWPGLPQLWLYGQWSGLAKAVGFAALLNFALIATFWFPESVAKNTLISSWALLGVTWIFAFLQSSSRPVDKESSSRGTQGNSVKSDELFLEAQSEYLQGHLDEAENHFERLIWLNSRDLDARMYLATIHRHRGRLNQAEHQLDMMERFDESAKWRFQILDERKLLAELEHELKSESEEDDSESEASEIAKKYAENQPDTVESSVEPSPLNHPGSPQNEMTTDKSTADVRRMDVTAGNSTNRNDEMTVNRTDAA